MAEFDARVQDERVRIGASWYPEMWPETEWVKDADRMAEIGFDVCRLFEFAWHRFEPTEGEYDFAWAKRILDLLHDRGVGVILGTPSAAPPAWLTTKCPDILQTTKDGRVKTHGQRKHGSHISHTYRQHCARIVEQMCRHLADHPAVVAWQIDNEMSGYDYGEEAVSRFHDWLENKYGDIATLNRTWGLEFWSQAYQDFSQIPMPVASVGSIEVPERHHPSLIFAVAHFQNDQWTDYIANQCDVIRRHTDKPITSNMTSGFGMHWYQHNRLLDRVGHSLYKDVDHYGWNVPSFDRMRAEKPGRPYWFLETAPNWSGGGRQWNIHHDESGIHAVTWLSTILGGSMTVYWQWRSHWAGQEMQHGTHVDATGRWMPNKEKWAQLANEFTEHGDWLLQNPPQPAQLAIMQSNEAAWSFSMDPIDVGMQYQERWRDDYYMPLVRHHLWRDIIDPEASLEPYRVLAIPMMPIVPNGLRDRLAAWVEAGGRLILGPLSGYRSEEFTAYTDRVFGGLEELMGVEASDGFTVQWVEDRCAVRFVDGQETRTRNWCWAFTPTSQATTLATYDGGYRSGGAAIVQHAYGKGTVTSLGCHVDEPTWLRLVSDTCDAASITPLASGDPDVIIAPRADRDDPQTLTGLGVVNLTEQSRTIDLPESGRDRLTGEMLTATLHLDPLQVRLIDLK